MCPTMDVAWAIMVLHMAFIFQKFWCSSDNQAFLYFTQQNYKFSCGCLKKLDSQRSEDRLLYIPVASLLTVISSDTTPRPKFFRKRRPRSNLVGR